MSFSANPAGKTAVVKKDLPVYPLRKGIQPEKIFVNIIYSKK
jgi:hypothetical protein